jgi:hypothetical protein
MHYPLNPEKDLEINVADLTSEFKKLSLLLFRYSKQKADAEREYDSLKATLKELRARVYKEIRLSGEKHTEKSLEAEIDTNDDVIRIQQLVIDAYAEYNTWYGAVDSLKAKKDMLIQLGADARKEL